MNLGNVTDPCITNPVEVSCPDGFTVSFWLRLQETGSSQAHGLKILGFGEPNDNRRGFIVIERDGQVVVQVTHESFKTEVSFDVIHGVWTHIVFTFRSLITLKVYRNGENLGSRTKSYGNFVDIVQPLSTGQAVAVINELMVWYKKFDQQTVIGMYEYLTGTLTDEGKSVLYYAPVRLRPSVSIVFFLSRVFEMTSAKRPDNWKC